MIAFDRPTLFVVAVALASHAAAAAEAPRRAEVGPVVVHPRGARPLAAPLGVAVVPGIVLATPFTVVAGASERVVRVPHYIGPDGTYDEHADLVRSVNGTPCGQACTRRSLLRWGFAPDD